MKPLTELELEARRSLCNRLKTMKKQDRFGISIPNYARQSEIWLIELLEAGEDPEVLLQVHLEKLHWFQHERLIHLIVLCLSVIMSMSALLLLILSSSSALTLVLTGVFGVLSVLYLIHYFKLENLVQHWYHVVDCLQNQKFHISDAFNDKK